MNLLSVYFDEDAAQRGLVEALRQSGVPVATPIEENLTGATNEYHLSNSASRGYVLYTFNVARRTATSLAEVAFCQISRIHVEPSRVSQPMALAETCH